ncbi:unnamed protein product [Lepidochelys kempii]
MFEVGKTVEWFVFAKYLVVTFLVCRSGGRPLRRGDTYGAKGGGGDLQGFRQPDGLLRKGPSQRELFSYLHSTRKEPWAERKHQAPGASQDYESDHETKVFNHQRSEVLE